MTAETGDFQVPSGVFETRLEVRWGDVDSLGHVNNTVYFRFFEEARVRLFASLGVENFVHRSMAIVLAHASCDFLKPLLYPACIVVDLKLVRVGRSSLEIESWIADVADSQRVYARGRNVIVCVDTRTQHPMAWPADELQALQRCFSE
ncbi:Acyl-CoA thioester hydrolase OS=Castellaniella defragrans OX=75697 GN=HNR28_003080 PE=4 SV=1 [Castellaniella defragrans]